jgi:hypothetical protein
MFNLMDPFLAIARRRGGVSLNHWFSVWTNMRLRSKTPRIIMASRQINLSGDILERISLKKHVKRPFLVLRQLSGHLPRPEIEVVVLDFSFRYPRWLQEVPKLNDRFDWFLWLHKVPKVNDGFDWFLWPHEVPKVNDGFDWLLFMTEEVWWLQEVPI